MLSGEEMFETSNLGNRPHCFLLGSSRHLTNQKVGFSGGYWRKDEYLMDSETDYTALDTSLDQPTY